MARAASRGRGKPTRGSKAKVPSRRPAPPKELPIQNYERLTVREVSHQLDPLTRVELRKLASFERTHRKRKGVLEAIERHLQGPSSRPAVRRAGQPGREG